MATAVFVHAHPDDEAIATGGTMARMADEGHRVVLVCATGGELGEVEEGFLSPGETLAQRRAAELDRAARELGVARVTSLGYRDSGMAGETSNDDPRCFWRADVDEAAARLADILRAERADVLTIYDERGTYGHPDHVQVHRVGRRAAELTAVPRLFMATVNRNHLLRLMQSADPDVLATLGGGPESIDNLGVDEGRITTAVDVTAFLDRKRRAMAAHASQITETSFFLRMPVDMFGAVWGTEWYIRVGAEPARPFETSLADPDPR